MKAVKKDMVHLEDAGNKSSQNMRRNPAFWPTHYML